MLNIYKASAGSGKTYTLAREYIKQLLGYRKEDGTYRLKPRQSNDHRSILAITFTNKATEEMKKRIIQELALLAEMERENKEKGEYLDYFLEIFSCTEQELRKAARSALKNLLYDFGFFSVSTIDSFFQTILRSFAREADVLGSYELELDYDSVVASGIDLLLKELNKNDSKLVDVLHLQNWLFDYMWALVMKGNDYQLFNRSSKVHENLIGFIKKINNDDFKEQERILIDYLSDSTNLDKLTKAINEEIKRLEENVAEACKKVMELAERYDYKEVVNNNVINPIKTCAEKGTYRKEEPSAAMRKAVSNADDIYKKGKQDNELRDILDIPIRNALEALIDCRAPLNILKTVSSNLYQLGLFVYVLIFINRYLLENSSILLRDTNELISKIIGAGIGDEYPDLDKIARDAPFLYERVGQQYNNYLIDEFQDTSFSQWRNIAPLVNESLANGFDNLVIGDEKQSIYRFRGSDSSLLHGLHQQKWVKDRSKVFGNSEGENTNWRSSRDIVEFNNDFFRTLSGKLGFADTYSNVCQQVASKKMTQRGHIKARVYEDRDSAFEFMKEELLRMLKNGYKPKDIVILIRKKSTGAQIIDYLQSLQNEHKDDAGFPDFRIVSEDSLFIDNCPIITFIVSRLRLIAASDVALTRHRKSNKEVAAIINRFEALKDNELTASQALINALSTTSEEIIKENKLENDLKIDLISLVESIIETHVNPTNRKQYAQYIAAFQDLVTEFVKLGRGDIRSFIKWWDDKGSKTTVQGVTDDNSINILTIHKAKGLEFPCVIIPFLDFSKKESGDIEWFKSESLPGIPDELVPPLLPLTLSKNLIETPFEKQYLEYKREMEVDDLNILYVAFTRAENELVIGIPKPSQKGESFTDQIYHTVEELHKEISTGTLIIGSPTFPKDKEKKKSAINPSGEIKIEDYELYHHPSIWEKTKLEDKFYNLDDAIERGNLLHDIMATILTVDDIPKAISTIRSTPKAKNLSESDIENVRELITKRITDPEVARWFKDYKKVFTERPISIGDGSTVRPDRIVWTADGHIDIVDYKSGHQPSEIYEKQMAEYVNQLTRMGLRNVRAYLYYLDSGKVRFMS